MKKAGAWSRICMYIGHTEKKVIAMVISWRRNIARRALSIILICCFGMGVCACGQKESITSGTIYVPIDSNSYSMNSRLSDLLKEAAEDLAMYVEGYNIDWNMGKFSDPPPAALSGQRLIGITEQRYIGYCFFDHGNYSDSPVYFIFQVSVLDSTGEESLTRTLYLVSRKLFYASHNTPYSVYGTDKFEFSSFTMDGFADLESVIARIKEETGKEDINSELYLNFNGESDLLVLQPLVYKNLLAVLFQHEDLVYAVFMKEGKPDYECPVTLSKDWFSPEVLEKTEFGTVLSMYYDGERMETYPLQVDPPLLLEYEGEIAASEQAELRKAEQDLRDFCTGA